VAWKGSGRAAHGEAEGGGGRLLSETKLQLQLEGNEWSRSTSELRGSLRKSGRGRRGSGAGCPRACRAWPEQEKTAAVKCGSSARNWALELAEQGVGVEVILLHVRDRKIRPCGECSTATRRWRPAEALGRRGTRARGQEGRGTAAGKARGDAWVLAEVGGGT
jgi:hypothetical protein